jgi:hypothetical protein
MLINRKLAALTALATAGLIGGGAVASGAAGTQHHKLPTTHPLVSTGTAANDTPTATDSDTVQSGDQSTPDQPGASEPAETTGETGNEQVAGDGPGGHADEPANPTADHQATGVE